MDVRGMQPTGSNSSIYDMNHSWNGTYPFFFEHPGITYIFNSFFNFVKEIRTDQQQEIYDTI